MTMLDRLVSIEGRYDDIDKLMADPEVSVNFARVQGLAKEQAAIRKIVEISREYRAVIQQLDETHALIREESDPEMVTFAKDEEVDLEKRKAKLETDLRVELIPKDPNDEKNVIMEIRAGTGGEEAALFARDLYEMYQRFAERRGFRFEVLDSAQTDLGGFREVILNIHGEGVYSALGREGGGHRVQRVPSTETQGRIHTSAATVAVLPEVETAKVDINWDKDVLEHVSRSGGPGGQNVNKVSSAIRLEHLPTGITVSMRDEKSQHKNRAKGRRIMLTRLYDHFQQANAAVRDSARKSMIGSGDRSQRIRTYNYPQNRVTDHRIGLTLHNLPAILDGKIDDLIDAVATSEEAKQLEQQTAV